jgi:hypothetical protein
MILAALVLLGGSISPARAALDLNVSDDAFRLAGNGSLSRLLPDANGVYDVGLIYHNEDDDRDATAVHLGALVTGEAGSGDVNVTAGLGLRAQYLSLEHDEGGGAALGGQFDVRFPGYDRISLAGYGYVQPGILSLGDVDRQTEWAASIGYEVLRDATAYVGYRQLRASLDDTDSFTVDDGWHVGLRLNF